VAAEINTFWALKVGEIDEQDLSDIMIKHPEEYQGGWGLAVAF
jgi:hypothetical protein